jgi:hypothetical protein
MNITTDQEYMEVSACMIQNRLRAQKRKTYTKMKRGERSAGNETLLENVSLLPLGGSLY